MSALRTWVERARADRTNGKTGLTTAEREELARLFVAAAHLKSRSFLMVAYGTGLRLSELCRLRVCDIDSHADRMCIRVEQGKGGKDRYVPLEQDVLELLRAWWRSEHPRLWMFAGWTASIRMAGKTTFILAGWLGMNVAG